MGSEESMAGTRGSALKTWSSILALPVSVAALVVAFWQTAELKEQFAMSGPVVSVTSQLQVQYDDNKKPVPANRDDSEHPVVNFDMFEKYSEVWMKVSITNNGRADTTLRTARMEISPDNWVDSTFDGPTIWCKEEKADSADCRKTFPYLLHPANSLVVYFPLSSWKDDFARTRFGGEGIPLEIRATGVQEPVKYTSGIRISL
ncbi:hypothetical protein [Amycolatopsis vancoresmycina]|nr:hypothetical protein [Amycolatopsis vancoresmycina]